MLYDDKAFYVFVSDDEYHTKKMYYRSSLYSYGARDGNRTHKILLPADFESAASTSSATLALLINYNT